MKTQLDKEVVRKYSQEFGITEEQVIELNAEFKAYDVDNNGTIDIKDLGHVNKVRIFTKSK